MTLLVCKHTFAHKVTKFFWSRLKKFRATHCHGNRQIILLKHQALAAEVCRSSITILLGSRIDVRVYLQDQFCSKMLDPTLRSTSATMQPPQKKICQKLQLRQSETYMLQLLGLVPSIGILSSSNTWELHRIHGEYDHKNEPTSTNIK